MEKKTLEGGSRWTTDSRTYGRKRSDPGSSGLERKVYAEFGTDNMERVTSGNKGRTGQKEGNGEN